MPTDRHIFGPYHDGRQQRFADPMVVFRRMLSPNSGDTLKALSDLSKNAAPEVQADVETRFAAVAQEALDLVPFDPVTGEGLTIDEMGELLSRFCAWMDTVKKNGATTPNSEPSSVPDSTTNDPPTSDASAGGSTDTAA